MTQGSPLRWRPGAGWLVLIGGGLWYTTELIDRKAIAAMSGEKPIAFVPAAGCPPQYGDSFLAHYAALGAPAGSVMPIFDSASAGDSGNAGRLAEAGLIYFGGGDARKLIGSISGTPAYDAIVAAYASGSVIVGMSAGAMALAEWGVPCDAGVGVLKGWGWLPDMIVAPHFTRDRADALDAALSDHPGTLGLGIPEDVALALGPGGEVETWGTGLIEGLHVPS